MAEKLTYSDRLSTATEKRRQWIEELVWRLIRFGGSTLMIMGSAVIVERWFGQSRIESILTILVMVACWKWSEKSFM